MDLPEKTLCYLESHIPELAHLAIKEAYWRALASGSNVLECENGLLVEVHPDGTKTTIKKMPAPIKVTIGQRLELK